MSTNTQIAASNLNSNFMKHLFHGLVLSVAVLTGCSSGAPTVVSRPGCTDPNAENYNAMANKDDGSCEYNEVVSDVFCTIADVAALRIGMTKQQVVDALGVYPYDILSSADGCEIHVYHARLAHQELVSKDADKTQPNNAGVKMYLPEIQEIQVFFRNGGMSSVLTDAAETTLPHTLACLANSMSDMCMNSEDYVVCGGCMNKNAMNYDSEAEVDDGSCMFKYGCTDPEASNYDDTAYVDNGACTYIGCTDEAAINYNPKALHSQKLCEYCPCDTEEYIYVKSDNPNCASPCIAIPRNGKDEATECTWCNLLDGEGNAKVQITLDGAKLNNK